MRAINKLSVVTIKSKNVAGRYADGGGLYLQVSPTGTKSWLFKFMRQGSAREMGLGPASIDRKQEDGVSLADARDAAVACRKLLRDGRDPIEARRQDQQADVVAALKSTTFKQCADDFYNLNKSGWRNPKHAAQVISTLRTYAYPVIGDVPVAQIDTPMVTKVLTPIWTTKRETARRVRGRIESVLGYAKAQGLRNGENPAAWRGNLADVFKVKSKSQEKQRVKHFPAMKYVEVPRFFSELRSRETISARALVFTILTAARSSETLGATVGEIDFENKIWTIPGERMKSGEDHQVPLSSEAMTVLRSLNLNGDQNTLLFPSPSGKELSNAAMRKYLQEDMGKPDLTVHGFRSSFRDWTAERTNFANEVAEKALAHAIADETEASYRRGELLEKRRRLATAWATYCTSGASAGGKVVPMNRAV